MVLSINIIMIHSRIFILNNHINADTQVINNIQNWDCKEDKENFHKVQRRQSAKNKKDIQILASILLLLIVIISATAFYLLKNSSHEAHYPRSDNKTKNTKDYEILKRQACLKKYILSLLKEYPNPEAYAIFYYCLQYIDDFPDQKEINVQDIDKIESLSDRKFILMPPGETSYICI